MYKRYTMIAGVIAFIGDCLYVSRGNMRNSLKDISRLN